MGSTQSAMSQASYANVAGICERIALVRKSRLSEMASYMISILIKWCSHNALHAWSLRFKVERLKFCKGQRFSSCRYKSKYLRHKTCTFGYVQNAKVYSCLSFASYCS